MTVGLFGWYHKGNFGDDLMAMMLTRELLGRGYEVMLWGIETKQAEQWGAEASHEVDSFLTSTDVLVFGGGGLLANAHVRDDFDHLVERVVQEASSRGVPVHGVSLGGDGTLSPDSISRGRSMLLEHVSLLTVRNRQDVSDVAQFGVQAHFHHDIVWTCPQYLSFDPTTTRSFSKSNRTIVNVEEKSFYRKTFLFILQVAMCLAPNFHLEHLSIIREDGDFHTLQKRAEDYGLADYTPYPGVKETLNKIIKADFLISSKMHIGMCALAMGIPFVSVFGEEKTRVMMEAVGVDRFFVGNRPMKSFKTLFGAFSDSGSLRQSFDEEKRDAQGHVERLVAVL
jgi:polysaccharide pyruvyl transferase WcaK-like protein